VSPSPIQNVPASVRQRLLNLARRQGEDFQFVLTRFALERLLCRLSLSSHSERFLLKGAMLLPVWSEEAYRPTKDLDLAVRDEISSDRISMIFRDLCLIPHPEDGLVFDPESIRVGRIRETQPEAEAGLRVQMVATLAAARIPIQVDIGFGDVVTPGSIDIEYPTLLDHSPPKLKAYSRETVVAEKFQIMVHFGIANSRLKDLYDLSVLARNFNFSGTVLAQAIQATFQRRLTKAPTEDPVALSSEFSSDPGKRAAWRSFLRRITKTRKATDLPDLSEVCGLLRSFLMPPSRAVASGEPFRDVWTASGLWQSEESV
jgi:predicted nucleotidyltransferase component of viral defense system